MDSPLARLGPGAGLGRGPVARLCLGRVGAGGSLHASRLGRGRPGAVALACCSLSPRVELEPGLVACLCPGLSGWDPLLNLAQGRVGSEGSSPACAGVESWSWAGCSIFVGTAAGGRCSAWPSGAGPILGPAGVRWSAGARVAGAVCSFAGRLGRPAKVVPCQPSMSWRTIVCSRPGPTPIADMRAPEICSRYSTYALAFAGSSSKVRQALMSSNQPGSSS